MAPKMHAAVVEQFRKPLSLLEWDVPSPGAGQILVKTEACGVCHTDLHAAYGDWPSPLRETRGPQAAPSGSSGTSGSALHVETGMRSSPSSQGILTARRLKCGPGRGPARLFLLN